MNDDDEDNEYHPDSGIILEVEEEELGPPLPEDPAIILERKKAAEFWSDPCWSEVKSLAEHYIW